MASAARSGLVFLPWQPGVCCAPPPAAFFPPLRGFKTAKARACRLHVGHRCKKRERARWEVRLQVAPQVSGLPRVRPSVVGRGVPAEPSNWTATVSWPLCAGTSRAPFLVTVERGGAHFGC